MNPFLSEPTLVNCADVEVGDHILCQGSKTHPEDNGQWVPILQIYYGYSDYYRLRTRAHSCYLEQSDQIEVRKCSSIAIWNQETKDKIAAEAKMMLHAHRDCLRNRWDSKNWNPAFVPSQHDQDNPNIGMTFDCREGYYGEAFGLLRAMVVLGFSKFGAVNIDGNVNSWMYELEQEVLKEENFGTSNECDWCLKRYGRDGAGRTNCITTTESLTMKKTMRSLSL